jgi:AcrR family transcriptional regulator
MGRPRQHDETTREALLAAAETIVEQNGTGAVSVRAVADAIGTSTRAVYSTYGSKEGLLVALAERAFALLRDDIARVPVTDDPAQDLVDAAVRVFRRMAIDHPSMFALAFLRAVPDLHLNEQVRMTGREGMLLLRARIQRLADAGLLGGRDVGEATMQFNAMCQGLAATELRNPDLLGPDPERAWRAAFETLLGGFRSPMTGDKARRARPAGQARRTRRQA